PGSEFGELNPWKFIVPGRHFILHSNRRHLSLIPDIFNQRAILVDFRVDHFSVILKMQGAAFWPQQSKVLAANWRRELAGKRIDIMACENRIEAPDGIGVIDSVTCADILKEDNGRNSAIINMSLEAALSLNHFDSIRFKPIEQVC